MADPATLCLPAGSLVGRRARSSPGCRSSACGPGEEVWAPLDLVASDPAERDDPGSPALVTAGDERARRRARRGAAGPPRDPRDPAAPHERAAVPGAGRPLARDRPGRARPGRRGGGAGRPLRRRGRGGRVQARGDGVRRLLDLRDGRRRRRLLAGPPDRLRRGGRPVGRSGACSRRCSSTRTPGPARRSASATGRRPAAVADPDYWAAVERGGADRRAAGRRRHAGLARPRAGAAARADRARPVAHASTATASRSRPPRSGDGSLAGLLATLAGHDVLAATTHVGEVHVAKVLVTGLEVETMSYGRIGELGVADLLGTDLGPGPARRRADRDATPTGWCSPPRRRSGSAGRPGTPTPPPSGSSAPRYPLYREPPRHLVEV